MRVPQLLILGIVAIIGLGVVAAAWMWHAAGQPLYNPGMLHESDYLAAPLQPPTQGKDFKRWLVEPGIELHHWSIGQGNPRQ